jgi:hypothetical protein
MATEISSTFTPRSIASGPNQPVPRTMGRRRDFEPEGASVIFKAGRQLEIFFKKSTYLYKDHTKVHTNTEIYQKDIKRLLHLPNCTKDPNKTKTTIKPLGLVLAEQPPLPRTTSTTEI